MNKYIVSYELDGKIVYVCDHYSYDGDITFTEERRLAKVYNNLADADNIGRKIINSKHQKVNIHYE